MALWLKAAYNMKRVSKDWPFSGCRAELSTAESFTSGSVQFTLCENVPGLRVWTKLNRRSYLPNFILTSFFLEPGRACGGDTTGK